MTFEIIGIIAILFITLGGAFLFVSLSVSILLKAISDYKNSKDKKEKEK